MTKKAVRCTVFITADLDQRLTQLLKPSAKHKTTRADLIREAIRRYLDDQEDLIGSRRHFQKSFQERLDRLETTLLFHLNTLLYLTAQDENAVRDAIIRSRRDGETLLAQIKAVRELELKP